MVQWAMIFVGGVLVASLLALMLISVVHDRAVRLTRRRIEASLPESLVEVQTDKDRLRADFAMSMHRLERSVEQLRFKAITQLREIGGKTEVVNRLRTELARKTEVADELADEVKSLTAKIEEVVRERERYAIEVISIERALSEKEAELVQLATEQRLVIDSQRAEIAALNAQIEQLHLPILQQFSDYTARGPFGEPMATLVIIEELEDEYQAAQFWESRRQIANEITTHNLRNDTDLVFTQPGSIAPDQQCP